jgi:hypothetical protein
MDVAARGSGDERWWCQEAQNEEFERHDTKKPQHEWIAEETRYVRNASD